MVIELEEEEKTLATLRPRNPYILCPSTAGHQQWHYQNGICPTAGVFRVGKVIPLPLGDFFWSLPVTFPSNLTLL